MRTIKTWLDRIIRSKTMWFNSVVAALAALEGSFNLLQPHIAGNVFAYATIILTVGNAYFRTLTNTALADK